MTKREAKRLICSLTYKLLDLEQVAENNGVWLFDAEGNPRSEEDKKRLQDAAQELLRELDRRSGYPDVTVDEAY